MLWNTGDSLTFQRAGYGSIVDLNFASSSLASSCWKVSEYYTHSDHQAILGEDKTKLQNETSSKLWVSDKLDQDTFVQSFSSEHLEDGSINEVADMKKSCDQCHEEDKAKEEGKTIGGIKKL